MLKKGIYIAVFLLLAVSRLVAQSLSVNAVIDKASILIGEPFRLTITMNGPKDQVSFIVLPDSLPHFDILEKGKIDTVASGNQYQLQQRITLTSFDSGRWEVPSFAVPNSNIITDSIRVDVGYAPMKEGEQLKDIRDIILVKTSLPWWLIITLSLVLLALIGALIWMLTRRSKRAAGFSFWKRKPAYEEAMLALDALKVPASDAEVKPYYVSLSTIFRRYVQREKQLQAEQFTTTELLEALALSSTEQQASLTDILHLGDAVKFAKFVPGDDQHQRAAVTIREVIGTLHQASKEKEKTS